MRLRTIVVALGLAAGLAQPTPLAAHSQEILDNSLVVRFLDAGDGEAVWMTTPNPDPAQRATILLDCGPPGFGGRLALELQSANVPRIDTLLLSGATDNVIGGCADVLQQVPVGEIRWTGQRGTTPTWAALEALLQASRWPLLGLSTQDAMAWGDVRGVVLNPPRLADARPDPDTTLVLEITYAGWGILFAGDVHEQGQRQTEYELGTRASAIQVLKVADHGSAAGSSLEFLTSVFDTSVAAAPRTAVITNGRTARSPQVDLSVLNNLQAVHAEAVNTAEHGTVTVVVHPDTGPHYVAER